MDISNTLQTTSEKNNKNAASEDADLRRRRKTGEEEEEEEELTEVEKRIVALQKIVPGGERLPVEDLFEETAEYILTLESQLKALRFLNAFLQTSQNMFGF